MATLLQQLVSISTAIENCKRNGSEEWVGRHRETLAKLLAQLPSGSGIDSGTLLVSLSADRAEFAADYHHMNVHGYYTHWSSYRIVVRPTFLGLDIKVVGEGKDTKEHLAEVFLATLSEEV